MLNILSLGAGRQSSYLYHASGRGILPKLDCAIFSDTGWEPQAVYDHLNWLISKWSPEYGIPIHVVSAGHIKEDALKSKVLGVKKDGVRWASMPYYTHAQWNADNIGLVDLEIAKREEEGKPADKLERIRDEVAAAGSFEQTGMIRRQCTKEYKIEAINKFIKTEILGLDATGKWPTDHVIRQWMGISFDEWTRMRKPVLNRNEKVQVGTDLFGEPVFEKRLVERVIRWQSNVYYLCDTEWFPDGDKCRRTKLGVETMTADDCVQWHLDNGLPEPPKSACIGCPYRSNASWRAMRDTRPNEWEEACEFDEAIRDCGAMRSQMYIHRQLVPLRVADIDDDVDDDGLFPCDGGVCGV